MMKIRRWLAKVHWVIGQFGIEPLRFFRAFRQVPAYLSDLFRFKKQYDGLLNLTPCLHDRCEEAGVVQSEYFWQDLTVARWIFEAKPTRHIDIGSRIDGFVAHIASFREVEVIDIRPVATKIPRVTFIQMDMMGDITLSHHFSDLCDSLSCLHAIEHFGLGRYGDPITPNGYILGIKNMCRLLVPGGTFYISAPIGRECVEFNAHRVFDPLAFVELIENCGFCLSRASVISNGVLTTLPPNHESVGMYRYEDYVLGIFEFIKA